MTTAAARVGLMFLLVASMLSLHRCTRPALRFDLLIRNGTIVDGSGGAAYRASIAIRGSRITAIGDLPPEGAAQTIDASGLIVAPGFIDLMGATSVPLLRDARRAENKLRQGVTTMMAGEGSSVAPQSDLTRKTRDGFVMTWSSFGDYFALLERSRIPINVVHNVGAGQVRRVIVGTEDRRPTAAQLAQMERLVDQAMRDGAIGLSTALIYPPDIYGSKEELVALAKVVARHRGLYFSHVRNESSRLLEAIREALDIGREAGVPVHIYHLKAAGRDNWPLMAEALAMIEAARREGDDVTADVYPYIRNGIGLRSFIRPERFARGTDTLVGTLGDPRVRDEIRHEIESTSDWENWYRHVGRDWHKVLITHAGPSQTKLVGMSIAEAAASKNADVWTTFFDLVQSMDVEVAPESMNEEQKRLAMRSEFVSFDTDSAPVNRETALSEHPRAFGTFPRVLAKYVRDEHVLTLEQAIRKMTAVAASQLRLHDRGRIAPGLAADLVIFDLGRVADTATFDRPLQFPEGIEHVIVNGESVVTGGKTTGAMPGKVLRPLLK